MVKPSRAFLGIAVFLFIFVALPVFSPFIFKTPAYAFLETPLSFSRAVAQTFLDLISFKKNADEKRSLERLAAHSENNRFKLRELETENARLAKLLDLRPAIEAGGFRRTFFARVIARSPSPWTRVILIDKGKRQGVRPNLLVLANETLVGKVIESGPSMSKVLLISDPNSRIGVLMQRTRHQGVLFGTSAGECRVKYLSLDAEIEPGDVVETVGFGGFFPKGLRIGTVVKSWKEPGQIYQVAQIRPFVDLTRLEEVVCVE